MTAEQIEAFPMTRIETAELFLVHFQAGVDKAEKSLDTARANLMHACQLRDIAEDNLRLLKGDAGQSVTEIVAEIVNSGALDTDGMTVTASVSPASRPITYEGWTCQQCGGEGRLPDKTGGGHHRCKECDGTGHVEPSCDNCTVTDCNIKQPSGSETMGCGGSLWIHGGRVATAKPCVVAVYPASNSFDEEPVATPVGQFTRYGELVADYGAAAGIEVTMGDFTVIGENDGRVRDLGAAIAREDYGKRLLVVPVTLMKKETA